LKQEFSNFGTVLDARIIKRRFGKSKGFGYVKFSKSEEVQSSLKMNG